MRLFEEELIRLRSDPAFIWTQNEWRGRCKAGDLRHALDAERAKNKQLTEDLLQAERDALAESERLIEALIECAVASGADVSGGIPTYPPVDVWAVQEVKQLRKDYEEG